MALPATGAPTLAQEQLAELQELIADADSVELKLTVPESDHYSAAAALGLDPLDAKIRQVYFFDTPDLSLNRHGVVARARRAQRKGGDVVVKVRPVIPRELPKPLRKAPGFTVEVDAMPGGHVCSGTLRRSVGNADIRQVVAGERSLGGLFSMEQRVLMSRYAPGIAVEDLSVLGPILVLKLRFGAEGYERRLAAELWMYPDNSRVLEVSTKCDPREAFLAAAETRVFLSKRSLELSGEQQTKTLKALEFFSTRLAERTETGENDRARSDAPLADATPTTGG